MQAIDLEKVKSEIMAAAAEFKKQSIFDVADARASGTNAQVNITAVRRTDFAPLMPLRLQREANQSELSPGVSFHYKEFKVFDNRHFVRNAYIAMLGHPPDPQGERHYVQLMRRGMTGAEILVRLRYSAEGRRNAVRLRGILIPAAVAFLYKIPLLGRILRWHAGLWNAPSDLKRLQDRLADFEDREAVNIDLVEARVNQALLAINLLQSERRNS